MFRLIIVTDTDYDSGSYFNISIMFNKTFANAPIMFANISITLPNVTMTFPTRFNYGVICALPLIKYLIYIVTAINPLMVKNFATRTP